MFDNFYQLEVASKAKAGLKEDGSCTILGKYKLFSDPNDDSLGKHLIIHGCWESGDTMAVLKTVQPGMRVVDVGGNLGYYSVLLKALVGETGSLFVFEPQREYMDLIEKSLKANNFTGNVTLSTRAAWDKFNEEVTFHVNPRLKGSTSIFGIEGGEPTFKSLTTTLDQEIKKADFIKIDAEGAEEKIWAGMQKLVKTNPDLVILMEVHAPRYKEPRQFYDSIARIYPLREIDPYGQLVETSVDGLLTKGHFSMVYLTNNDKVIKRFNDLTRPMRIIPKNNFSVSLNGDTRQFTQGQAVEVPVEMVGVLLHSHLKDEFDEIDPTKGGDINGRQNGLSDLQ